MEITTKSAHRVPEIVLQLDQGVVSKRAREKAWYRVETPGADGILGTSDDQHVRVSKVIYHPRTHAITVIMPQRPNVRGDVVLTIDARGIVNLLGQQIDADSVVPDVNFVREIDLP